MQSWNRPPYKMAGGDIETVGGARPFNESMLESKEIRWSFIRKVCTILSIQMLLTIAVSVLVIKLKPISHFFVSSWLGLTLYIFLFIFPFLVLLPLYFCHQLHPINLFLLSFFIISISFTVGLSCAFIEGRIILEAAVLVASGFIGFTLFSFWALKEGYDFSLPLMMLALSIVLTAFYVIQMIWPSRGSDVVDSIFAAEIFTAYIVYETDNLIKRCA